MSKNQLIVCITGDIDSGENESINSLNVYFDTLKKYKVRATIPVTAEAVINYQDRIEFIIRSGHEIAGHGDVHKEFYGSVFKQIDRLKRMVKIIKNILDVEVTGFRAPWYKHDKNTYVALEKVGLKYDSSQTRYEIAFKGIPFIEKKYIDFRGYRLVKPLLIHTAQMYNSIYKINRYPYFISGHLLEIPVLGISDYSMIQSSKGPKYSPENAQKIGEIWLECLKYLQDKDGGVLVIQAHPGRLSPKYISGIEYFISRALNNGAIFKTLNSISEEFSGETIK